MNKKIIAVLFFLTIVLAVFYFNYETYDDSNLLSLEEIYNNNASLETVEYEHGVRKVVYIVWFGRQISINRLRALNSLIKNINVPYILITEDNYKSFEKENHPFHRGFEYLSGNHISDYLRSYLLHFHGGGYHDIKYRDIGWENEWSVFKDDKIWMKSCREQKKHHIGYDIDKPKTKKVQQFYNELGSMSWIISKSNTDYTKKLLDKIEKRLYFHLDKLKQNPSEKNAGYYADRPFQKLTDKDKYPIRWLELMGEHFHLLMYRYRDHMDLTLPRPNMKNYK